jgi:hypothetical protein
MEDKEDILVNLIDRVCGKTHACCPLTRANVSDLLWESPCERLGLSNKNPLYKSTRLQKNKGHTFLILRHLLNTYIGFYMYTHI